MYMYIYIFGEWHLVDAKVENIEHWFRADKKEGDREGRGLGREGSGSGGGVTVTGSTTGDTTYLSDNVHKLTSAGPGIFIVRSLDALSYSRFGTNTHRG